MTIKGKTQSGFKYEVSKKRLDNYELLEAIGDLDDNPLVLTKVVKLLLGKEQTEKLKDHLRTDDGIVPTEKLSEEITEIFQSQSETKNS
ncbi:hypothetical protein AB6834_09415 [Carnobacterium divergens]|uniref:hypothetical protein n=1 Tax=Carnobacterium divergens TaxID=2748 RepID=UPI00289195A9|nr:hypothetical protein [Carnobacterium divergens]MDT1997232.1 hypothetical protein [Carnobacterium divergens]